MFSHIYTNVFLGCMWKWYSGSACCKIFGYLVGMANLYNYPVKQHENHTRKPPAIIDIDHHHLSSSRLPRFMLAHRFLCLPIVVKILWPCLTRYPPAGQGVHNMHNIVRNTKTDNMHIIVGNNRTGQHEISFATEHINFLSLWKWKHSAQF